MKTISRSKRCPECDSDNTESMNKQQFCLDCGHKFSLGQNEMAQERYRR